MENKRNSLVLIETDRFKNWPTKQKQIKPPQISSMQNFYNKEKNESVFGANLSGTSLNEINH